MMAADQSSGLRASVVVAAYSSGAELDRLVASLDAQTLPTDQWEAIFIDDGSPDDTFARLTEFARTRPHFIVERIPNSGWPCRPRNTGLDRARGEYVAFMDHDDELYPDALRAGCAFADQHGADVLNGKEARTDDAAWALSTYDADRGQVLGLARQVGALVPMNPHKLYRREFLQEHGIRFREGGRVLWEDVFFNLQVLANAEVVATMASTPYYHWNTTAGSGSTTFRRSKPEWWYWFGEMLEAIEHDLAAEHLTHERDVLLASQYRSRLLDAFGNAYPGRPAPIRKLIFEHARRLQQEHFPADHDRALDARDRLRAHLLRLGHPHALHLLIEADPTSSPRAVIDAVRRDGDALDISFTAEWVTEHGPIRLRRNADRITKTLPPEFDTLFDAEMLDVTDAVRSATAALGVRSRTSRVAWEAPTTTEITETTDAASAAFTFSVRGAAAVTPLVAAFGSPLEPGVWDLFAHCVLGHTSRKALLTGDVAPVAAIGPHGVCSVYTAEDGVVVLDVGQSGEQLASLVSATGDVVREDDALHVAVTSLGGLADGDEIRTDVWRTDATGRRLWQLKAAVRSGRSETPDALVPGSIRRSDGRTWLTLPAPDDALEYHVLLGSRTPHGGRLYQVTRGGRMREVARRR